MKPYFEEECGVIYCGDCRDILPQLDTHVDLILTDPPYGNGTKYGNYMDTPENIIATMDTISPQLSRLSDLIAFTPGIANMYSYSKPSWVLCWYVGLNGMGSSKWGFNCWQPILVYGADPYLKNGLGRRPDVIIHEFENQFSKGFNYLQQHPCPKPEKTWSKLITRLSVNIEDIILDPFLGSGTTAVCAKKLNRKYIGIEIEEKYCEIAVKRLSQSVMNLEIH